MAEPALRQQTLAPFEAELRITDPRDDSLVGTLPVATHHDALAAVADARAAWPLWRAKPVAERATLLHRAAEALRDAEQQLAAINTRETGRPTEEARGGVRAGAATLEQYAEYAPLHRGHSLNGAPSAVDFTRREPRGVALALTPWNDPVAVACGLIGAAAVMGNTVVHKPSERSPHTGRLLGELLADVFGGVVSTVTGGARTGAALIDAGVDIVAHVGSSAAGTAIAIAAARTGAHVIRENGGNDPLIVDAGLDPAWAARQAATGAYTNAGQLCTAVERVYVHEGIAAEFTDELCAIARSLNESGALGPLVDEELRERVEAQVADAIAHGARPLVGGAVPAGAGSHYPATVLADCTGELRIMREETFGPVAPVMTVGTFEDALGAACDDGYGLAATVLTPSLAHALAAADRLPVGTVKVGGVFGGAPGGSAQPRRASGAGFGYGPELLDEMSTTKVVHLEAAGEPA